MLITVKLLTLDREAALHIQFEINRVRLITIQEQTQINLVFLVCIVLYFIFFSSI